MTGSANRTLERRAEARRWLQWIIVLALVLRVASALYQGDSISPLPGVHDQISYDALALRVTEGHGFSFDRGWWPATRPGEPTSHWSYLYTLFLAGVYSIFGHNPLVARLIQAIAAGILQPWLTWRLGLRLFGPSTALWAAFLCSVYSYFVFYAGALVTETFFILAVLWTLDISTRAVERSGAQSNSSTPARTWILLGLASGSAVLLRQVFLLFVPFLLIWLWWKLPSSGQTPRYRSLASCRGPAIAALTIALLVLPWTVRNYFAYDRFVVLNSNAGFAFFWSNHPIHETSFMPILPPELPQYRDLIPPGLRELNEAALDQALLREGLRFVWEDPTRYVVLSVNRIKDFFKFWPSSDSTLTSNLARVAGFGAFLPFILIGIVTSLVERWRRTPAPKDNISLVSITYFFIVFYTSIHLLSWALIRYRLPVDAVLILFAGFGLASLMAWSTSKLMPIRQRRKPGNQCLTEPVPPTSSQMCGQPTGITHDRPLQRCFIQGW